MRRHRRWPQVVAVLVAPSFLLGACAAAGTSASRPTASTDAGSATSSSTGRGPHGGAPPVSHPGHRISTAGTHTTTTAGTHTTTTAGTHTTTTAGTPTATATWSLVTEPDDGMQPIDTLLSSARRTLDMTMYELADPTALGILEADARRGVHVRVLLDRAYSGASVNAPAYSALGAAGVEVRWAPAGTIFHQKTFTVDDHTSAIMTLNLTSEYYATTRDFAVVTTDPGDVAAIEQVFAADWVDTGPPSGGPTGADLVWSPGAEGPIVSLIGSARHSLLVENEEMADGDVVTALEAAARRGVDVEVVMTDSSSWTADFDQLAAAGVHVRTYAPDAPLYIHAKVVVADGAEMFLGSQNFSVSSLEYNRELGLVTGDAALVAPVARTVASDFAGASPLSAPGGSPTPPSSPGGVAASCTATASPADDGYAGDYDVSVHSNQPDQKATASDAGDTYSEYTDASGYAEIRLWNTTRGETITVTVGGARCETTASG